jgi:hypothetical protein
MEKLFEALLSRADLFPHQPALISDKGDNKITMTPVQLTQA